MSTSELKAKLNEVKYHNRLKRRVAEWEFNLRAKLLEQIEGIVGKDDGFASLETATLRELVFKLTGKDPMEIEL